MKNDQYFSFKILGGTLMKQVGLMFVALFALFGTAAMAQTTAANTQISNQASATYLDSLGNPQTTNSNVAITVVQAVYGYTITPNGSSYAAPGQTQNQIPGSTVNFAYQITNTSNTGIIVNLTVAQEASGTDGDTFDLTSPVIYDDANQNGQVDFGESVITSISLTQLAPGSIKYFVVAGGIPSATPSAGRANINITSIGNGAASGATDNVNFARVDVINDADLTLVKTASAPVLNGTSGLYEITYGLSGSNAGNLPAKSKPAVATVTTAQDGILIYDTIPTGTTYVTGSAAGSAGAVGAVTVVYSSATTGNTWSATETSPVARVGLLMRDVLSTDGVSTNTLNIGATYTLGFKVSIPLTTAGLTTISNVAAVDYRNNNGITNVTVPSNTVTSTYPEIKATAIGPNQNPTGNPPASLPGYTDPVSGLTFAYAGSGIGYPTNTTDKETVATASSGTVVTFVNTVRNTGNTTNTFNISVQSVTSGYSAALYQSDGSTGLIGGVTLAPGANYNVIVKVTIPASATPSATANVTAVIKSDAGSSSDITTDVLTAITSGQNVDIRNNDNSTTTVPLAGTTDTGVAITTNPGTTVYYPLTIQNTGVVNDTYALTSSLLPSGATVLFYLDTNGDGLPDGSPISSTAVLNPNQIVQLVAVVTVPANAAPTTAAVVTFTTTSNSNGTISDSINNTLTINAINSILFTPDRNSSITSPGTVVYQHTLTNNGNSSATITLAPGTGVAGFTYVIYRDNGSTPGAIDATDTILYSGTSASLTLAAGASTPVLVEVTAISGLADATVDARIITASATFSAGSASASVTDTTKIVLGKLDLQKSVNNATAFPRTAPGVTAASSEITYTIVATNLGSGALSNVIIFDPIPGYTDFKLGTANVTGCPAGSTCTIEYSTDGGGTWSATAPADSVNTGTSAGYSDNQDALRVTNLRVVVTNASGNTFASGASITLTFTVSVR
jgi:trimeric autotransporter adhesin